MSNSGKILILYGSQTFTAKEIAERIWRTTKVFGFRGPVQAMDDYPISKLIHEELALFVCATTGQGDEPDNMKKFWRFLLRKNLPTNSLVKLKFGVLGLGDSSYAKFNIAAKKLHKRLVQLGAVPLLDIGLCDYQHDLGHDAVMIPWTKDFFSILQTYYPNIQTTELQNNFIPRWKVNLTKNEVIFNKTCINTITDDIYFVNGAAKADIDAYLLEVEKNDRITSESHFQDVRLMTLKTSGSMPLVYKPGDVLNIRPRNSKEDIEDLFSIFVEHNIDIKPHYKLQVDECHEDMPVPVFLQQPLTMYEIAEQYWDLRAFPTQYVFALLAQVSEDKLEKDKCIELSTAEGQEDWLNYCRRPRRTVLEVLHDFHKTASKLKIEVLFELFSTIKPRYFSIASSCLASEGYQLDLLVAVVHYYSKLKKPRLGLCSNWLKSLVIGDRVYGWIKKGTLAFPSDWTTPHILIGPGTGLAPFRSLLQERKMQGAAHKHTMHLYFGCRYRNKDYHCREELEKLEAEGKVTLCCAFSRDQEHKIYVQHKITEHKESLWKLINENGAYIFISGNSKNMPDNVKDAFIDDVFGKAGGLNADDAKDMMRKLEDEDRVQVEAY